MPTIRLRTDSEVVEFELREGVNSIGRSPENDIVVDHSSVSSRHCRLDVTGETVLVSDLESANGTLLGGNLVEQSAWISGQVLQVGPAYLELLDPLGSGVSASADTAGSNMNPGAADVLDPVFADGAAASAGASVCEHHPDRRAEFFCRPCGHRFCGSCVKQLGRVGPQEVFLCVDCGARCEPVGATGANQELPEPGFFRALPDAWAYPFRKDGWILLSGASLLFALLDSVPVFIGIFAIAAIVFLSGYICAYLQKVVLTSAQGEDRMPAWPDISDIVGDVLSPLLLVIGSVLVCLGPGWGLIVFGDPSMAPLGRALLLGGVLYLPMAFLAVSMHDSLWALNPFLVIPALLRVPVPYAVTCLVLAVAVALSAFSGAVIDALRIPVLSTLLASFAALYFLMVEMRLLGVLYWTNRDEFGWFR